MISEEKLMMKLLRDYYICKLYARTSISSRNISSLTGVSVATVKRAIHLLEERKEECLRLLPISFEKAVRDGVLSENEYLYELEYINEEHLNSLQTEIEMTAMNLQNKNRWLTSSMESGSILINTVEKINNRYFSQKRDIILTKNQVKNLIEFGNSFQEAANALGICKTTAYNYYKADTIVDDDTCLEQTNATRKR